MDLPDNYFRDKSPADIIAKVATITLANISLMGETTLRRIGWLDNPIVDILYSLTSAGVWVANVTSAGAYIVDEAHASAHYYSTLNGLDRNMVLNGLGKTPGASVYSEGRFTKVTLTVAGGAGAVAATDIVAADPANKLLLIKVRASLSTNTNAMSGGTVTFKDADSVVLGYLHVNQVRPVDEAELIFAPTSAVNKKITAEFAAGTMTACDNGDTIDIQGLFAAIGS